MLPLGKEKVILGACVACDWGSLQVVDGAARRCELSKGGLMRCRSCNLENPTPLCFLCRRHVADLWQPRSLTIAGTNVHAPFIYDGPLKTLVRKAKIDNDWMAAEVCRALLVQSYSMMPPFPLPPTFVSAGANIRSRWHLKLCLAEVLAEAMASFYNRRWARMPWYLRFQSKKRAGGSRSWEVGRGVLALKMLDKRLKIAEKHSERAGGEIVVIDDVVTTGFTMASICSEYGKVGQGLALCYAPSLEVGFDGKYTPH